MILSKTTISLLCVLLLLSIFVANLLNIISTEHSISENQSQGENFTKHLSEKYGQLTDTKENLIWFLQISDIHLSIFRDPGRISQFQQFCDSTVKNIKPSVVLATGDLTDAKAKDNLGSYQIEREWIYYHNIIRESKVTDYTTWLDIRGNHDNFNIKAINAQENYYRNFSIQGKAHARSYIHYVNKNGVSVAFVGIDACPEPGLRRPFNFIGILDAQEQKHLRKLQAEANANADHIIWFGHYPTSCILTLDIDNDKLDVRTLIGDSKGSQAYVCGHLHAMGGLVPKMYTKHRKGYLEIELADWKDNRMYRLAAIDHGIFSFVDQKHNSWPVALVTNPKHAKYTLPGREPLQLIPNSSHIRILAFSDADIKTVQISFDRISWMDCKHSDGPLYVCLWLPHLFTKDVNYIYVIVSDEQGKQAFVEHPFSLDGSTINYEVTPRILLMLDACAVFQAIFGSLLVINVLPIVYLRLLKQPPRYRRRFGRYVLRKVWLLSKIDKIYYPIVLYAMYVPLGPWAVGELIDGHVGVVFAWGILIKGTFLPEAFTYMYGSVQLMFIQIPLVFVLSHTLENRLYNPHASGTERLLRNLPFILLLSIQLLLAYFFWLEYGSLAFLFGPLRTWSIVLSLTLWYKVVTLPPDYCRKLIHLNEYIPS